MIKTAAPSRRSTASRPRRARTRPSRACWATSPSRRPWPSSTAGPSTRCGCTASSWAATRATATAWTWCRPATTAAAPVVGRRRSGLLLSPSRWRWSWSWLSLCCRSCQGAQAGWSSSSSGKGVYTAHRTQSEGQGNADLYVSDYFGSLPQVITVPLKTCTEWHLWGGSPFASTLPGYYRQRNLLGPLYSYTLSFAN